MRKSLIALTAILAAAAPAVAAERMSPEDRLARVTEGRIAGEPVDCIDPRRFGSAQIIDGTAIVYEGVGGTLYVNRPDGEQLLDRWDVLVTRIHGSRLCRGDIVSLAEPTSLMPAGSVRLGAFVPYRRADD